MSVCVCESLSAAACLCVIFSHRGWLSSLPRHSVELGDVEKITLALNVMSEPDSVQICKETVIERGREGSWEYNGASYLHK